MGSSYPVLSSRNCNGVGNWNYIVACIFTSFFFALSFSAVKREHGCRFQVCAGIQKVKVSNHPVFFTYVSVITRGSFEIDNGHNFPLKKLLYLYLTNDNCYNLVTFNGKFSDFFTVNQI